MIMRPNVMRLIRRNPWHSRVSTTPWPRVCGTGLPRWIGHSSGGNMAATGARYAAARRCHLNAWRQTRRPSSQFRRPPRIERRADNQPGSLMAKTAHVQVRRVYDPAEPEDGQRVLVDRLWPRGLSKERAQLDDWCKEIAPSNELRKWYGHDPDRYAEFARRYRAE